MHFPKHTNMGYQKNKNCKNFKYFSIMSIKSIAKVHNLAKNFVQRQIGVEQGVY
jgi:hypothetical protein